MKARVRCGALMVNGFQCDARAKWWVRTPSRMTPTISNPHAWEYAAPRCGNHARAYVASWPMLSRDPEGDYFAAERMVRSGT